MQSFNALTLSHQFLSEHIEPGDFCIDATAGRGNDTAFLCSLVGETGKVLAFDIQQDAVLSTQKRLLDCGYADRACVLLDSHSHIDRYAQPGTVQAVTFNFGWLPGGDHTIFTQPDTSLEALEKSLPLLTPDGVISICIYYGRETGFAEKETIYEWLKNVDSKIYSVLWNEFINRRNCPPIAAFLLKGI